MPMPRTVVNAFNAGILSPRLRSREDFQKYLSGCLTLKNWKIHSHGGCSPRPGFQYIGECYSHNHKSRGIAFEFNTEQAYIIEFSGAGVIQFWKEDGQIAAVRTITGITQANPAVVTFDADHEFLDGQSITITGVEGMTEVNDLSFTVANGSGATLELSGVDSSAYTAYSAAGEASGKYQIEHGFTEDQLFQLDWDQTNDKMWIVNTNVVPQVLIRSAHSRWTIEDIPTGNLPAEWSVGNYPGAIKFHDGRLYYGGAPSHPKTVWGSVGDDFDVFTVSTPDLVATDRVMYTINNGRQDSILWLESGENLLIGTAGGEHWMRGATSDEAITATSVQTRRASGRGSQPFVRPVLAGNTLLYAQRHGHVLREFLFDPGTDAHEGRDLGVLSEHLFRKSNVIKDMAYQQDPDSIVWVVRSDGTLLGFTYNREHEVFGWHEHSTGPLGAHSFESIAVMPGDNRDEVWAVVNREIGGQTKRYMERMAEDWDGEADDVEDATFLDSWATYSGAAATTITGATHLVGETVGSLANGGVQPTKVVDANGEIELRKAYTLVHVGLPYNCDLEPMPISTYSMGGLLRGQIHRVISVDVNLYNAHGLLCGPDEDNLDVVPFRKTTDPSATAPALFTGTKAVMQPGNFDLEQRVFLRHSEPLPCTILNLAVQLEVSE